MVFYLRNTSHREKNVDVKVVDNESKV